ncbi:hypothetical protein [Asticcacaulis sp. W401b]|uniref:hypothetical protein n=1 Tax=Asticcacaulis sp. W401b TaxID=3388666 RepID=UPI0039711560
MIDAVTGVMIIALTAAVVLTTLGLSRSYRQRAETDRAAATAFSYLMATVPKVPGTQRGDVAGFRYQADISKEPVGILTSCRVTLSLKYVRFKRSYRLSGLRPCEGALP